MGKLKSCGFLIFRDKLDHEVSGTAVDPNSLSKIESPLPLTTDQISFLLLKHPTRWDLPKGHVDPGETNMECAIRELEEETGIQKQDLVIDPDFKYKQRYMVSSKRTKGKPKKKKLIIYAAKLRQPVELKLTEHEGFQWFDWTPPHYIQEKTIDPLLEAIYNHWQASVDTLAGSRPPTGSTSPSTDQA